MTEPPSPPAEAQSKGWGCGKTLLVVVGLLAVGLAAVFAAERASYEPPTPEQLERQAEQERERAERRAADDAAFVCKKAVGARLRAPSTAEWSRPLPEAQRMADGKFEATGWVDAQNAFGAMIRNDFRCVVARGRVEDVDIQAR